MIRITTLAGAGLLAGLFTVPAGADPGLDTLRSRTQTINRAIERQSREALRLRPSPAQAAALPELRQAPEVETGRQSVLIATLPLRREPTALATPVGQLPRGTAVTVVERAGEWVQVIHDEQVAWVPAAGIEE